METGDGRNQKLFNYILTLQANDFTKEEAKECIKIINKYILLDPLDEKELDTILRDDAFQKPVFFLVLQTHYVMICLIKSAGRNWEIQGRSHYEKVGRKY